jgi:hypothetical protein
VQALESGNSLRAMGSLWPRFRDAGRTLGVLKALALTPRWAVRRKYFVVVRDWPHDETDMPARLRSVTYVGPRYFVRGG